MDDMNEVIDATFKNEENVKALFSLAGIQVLKTKALIDGYGYSPKDSRFFENLPRCVWWFVKTPWGWVEIGQRKRVISIDWQDTPVRRVITVDDVTKDEYSIHAWSIAQTIRFLTLLMVELKKHPTYHAEHPSQNCP
jgi:hypothetical protein